jgi:hypothetical protein
MFVGLSQYLFIDCNFQAYKLVIYYLVDTLNWLRKTIEKIEAIW